MSLDPSRVPSGLSWGVRGFRVGKSVSGNWWVSLGLPFGFRYTWLLGRSTRSVKNLGRQEEVIVNDSIEMLPAPKREVDIISRVNLRSYSKIKTKK